jgi:hypothetical protein
MLLRGAGDGWSPRAEDAILHGCIPVLIMDNVDPVFGNALNWESFSIRIPEVISFSCLILIQLPPGHLELASRG